MKFDWTDDYFDEFYLKYFLLSQSDELTKVQVKFLENLVKPGGKLLDAGCGIGRHSILLAKDGFKVVGIDTSQIFLDEANKLLKSMEVENCEFKFLDMRKLEFKNEFDSVINLWSSFGYFDDGTNFEILTRFYRALKEEGVLIVDIENRDYILKNFIYETFKEKDNLFILERRKFDPITSIIKTHRYFIGENLRKDYLRYIRIYSATEIIHFFKEVGFKKIKVFGDYSGEEFSVSSKRIIISGEKLD
jgi:ubiquinone/menaquinone biosynthesis C-methylase UbiE